MNTADTNELIARHQKSLSYAIGKKVVITIAPDPSTYTPQQQQEIAEAIVEKTAIACGVSPGDIKSESRLRKITDARFIAIHFILLNTRLTRTQIGNVVNRDHSTVITSLKQYNNLYNSNREFKDEADKVGSILISQLNLMGHD